MRALDLDIKVCGVPVTMERVTRFTPGQPPPAPAATGERQPVDADATTIVLKNVPFQLRVEQLQAILQRTLAMRVRYVNYHLDQEGKFRGLAFVKFGSVDDATVALGVCGRMEINGRMLRAEWKRSRSRTAPHASPLAMALDRAELHGEELTYFDKIVSWLNSSLDELTFPPTLSTEQRTTVHSLAARIGLEHESSGKGPSRFITVRRNARTQHARARTASRPCCPARGPGRP